MKVTTCQRCGSQRSDWSKLCSKCGGAKFEFQEEQMKQSTALEMPGTYRGLILDSENPLQTSVQTRDGRKARLLAVDLKGEKPLVAAVATQFNSNGEPIYEAIHSYNATGILHSDDPGSGYDLVNAPKTHEVWVNFYGNFDGFADAFCAHPTRKVADEKSAHLQRLACVRIVFQEGEGL